MSFEKVDFRSETAETTREAHLVTEKQSKSEVVCAEWITRAETIFY